MKNKLLLSTLAAYILVVVYLFVKLSFWIALGSSVLALFCFLIVFLIFDNIIQETKYYPDDYIHHREELEKEVENIVKLSK